MKKDSKLIIANAVIWAALIIASSLIFAFTDADKTEAFGYALVVVFIPLYFASEQILRRALKGGAPC